MSEIEPGGSLPFLNVLNDEFDDRYRFIDKGNLQGSFNINVYRACAPQFPCDLRSGQATPYAASGAAFELQYNPLGNDPQGNGVHWIQRAIRNYDVDFISGLIVNDQVHTDRIDINSTRSPSPYYDESFLGSNSSVFRDIAHVGLGYSRTNHYFYAELYLVNELAEAYVDPFTGISKKQVEIYNGVRWGWESTFTPKDDDDNYCPVAPEECTSEDPPPPSDPPVGNCAYSGEPFEPCPPDGGFSPSAARDLAFVNSNPSSEPTSVPEPGSALAVLAVGIYGGISWRKQKAMK